MLRVNQFRDQHRSRAVSNGDTESDEEPGGDEHGEVDADGLEDDAENHDDTADHHTGSSAEDIRDIGDDW